jgi:Flp pilus assembly protein TadG
MRRRRRHSAILRCLVRNQAGAALVEFSLLAPFLVFLALGMTEFGRFLYHYQMVLEGLRDAGRYIARLDPTNATNQGNARNLAVFGAINGTGTARVPGWTTANISFNPQTISNSAGTYRGPATIRVVEVTTTFSYADVGFLSVLGLGSISVNAAHEQRVIEE